MITLISSFLILFSSLFQETTGDWIYSGTSDAGNIFYYNSKFVKKEGAKITIWTKMLYDKPKEKDGKVLSYELTLEECNCKNLSTKILVMGQFSIKDELFNSVNYENDEERIAPEGSIVHGYITRICKRFNQKKKPRIK